MNTRALTLAWRGVRLDTRRPQTYVVRLALLTGLFVVLLFQAGMSWRIGAAGRDLLGSVFVADVLAIVALAVTLFATSVTQEKELQTLGLLRLAGFGPIAILLGTTAGQLAGAIGLLLVQVPFMLLSVTLGGVSTTHVLALFGALVAFTLFASALALCASTVFAESRAASGATVGALIVYTFLPGWAMALPGWELGQTVGQALGAVSIWGAFSALASEPGHVVTIAAAHVGLGLGLFTVAWATFERRNRDERPAAPSRPAGLRSGAGVRVTGEPIAWKDRRFIAGGTSGTVVRFVRYGLVALAFLLFSGMNASRPEHVGALLLGIAVFGGALDACIYASRTFREEIQWGTLPVLLTVPMAPGRIVVRKLAALTLVLVPAVCVLVLALLVAPGDVGELIGEAFDSGVGFYVVSVLFITFVLTLHMSLHVRRGALVLALATIVAAHVVGWFLIVSAHGDEACFHGLLIVGDAAAATSLAAVEPKVRRLGGRS